MIRIETGSRLHFGLLSLPGQSSTQRQCGGIGLMVQAPGIALSVQPAKEWGAAGPFADRVLELAGRLQSRFEGKLAPQQIEIERAAPHHQGLGTGTQLALAIGHALLTASGINVPMIETAQWLGRGDRSAVGIHGFQQGGFLVEGGKATADAPSPLLARWEFPPEWQILLLVPSFSQGLHGLEERQAFEQLRQSSTGERETERLCRLLLLGMLPALVERDLPAFGESLWEFNRRVGEMFACCQGGPYAHPRLEELVEYLRRQGVRGVGQSSWGGTVFAIVPEDEVNKAKEGLQCWLPTDVAVVATTARNEGAGVSC